MNNFRVTVVDSLGRDLRLIEEHIPGLAEARLRAIDLACLIQNSDCGVRVEELRNGTWYAVDGEWNR